VNSSFVILVTGSSGFIGANLCQHLHALGVAVIGLDRLPAKINHPLYHHIQHDLLGLNAEELLNYTGRVDAIIHLAARTDLDGSHLLDYNTNIEGVRLISDSYYGLSKVLGEVCFSSIFSDRPDIRWIIFRPTTVWGPGMSHHYQKFFRLLVSRKYFHIGRNMCLKSYSYIDNASSQICDLLFNSARYVSGSTHYVCDENPIEISQWINDLSIRLGCARPLVMPKAMMFILAFLNDTLSSFLRLKKPLIPLTRRRYFNITSSYLYKSPLLWSSPEIDYVPYSTAIKETASWFLSLAANDT